MQTWHKFLLWTSLALILLLILPLLLTSITVVPYNQLAIPYNSISNRFPKQLENAIQGKTTFMLPSTRLVRLPAEQQLLLVETPVRARTADNKNVSIKAQAYYSFDVSTGTDFIKFYQTYGSNFNLYFQQAFRGAVFRLTTQTNLSLISTTLSNPKNYQSMLPTDYKLSYIFITSIDK